MNVSGPGGDMVRAIAVDPTSPSTVYVASDRRGVMKTTTGGASWVEINFGLTDLEVTALAIDPSNSSIVYGGASSGVFKTTTGGQSWSAISTGLPSATVNALVIDPTNPATVFAATYWGLFKTTNGGGNWIEMDSGLPPQAGNVPIPIVFALVLDPTNPSTLYAGATGYPTGGVYQTTNGGASWSAVNTGLPVDQVRSLAIDPTNPMTLYAGTINHGAYKTTSGGASWTAINTGLTANWVQALVVDPANPGVAYAGLDDAIGSVYKTTNGGASWNAVNAGFPRPLTVNVLAMDPTAPGTLYAGTRGAGVLKTTDAAAMWSGLSTDLLPSFVSDLVVDPTSPGTVYAATSVGVFKTATGGASWSPVRTGLPLSVAAVSLVVDAASPGTLYLGTEGDGIFRTTTGGTIWSAANAGLPTNDVLSLATDATNAGIVYAGTDMGVFKTTNGGASWSGVNFGLPASTLVVALVTDPTDPAIVYAGTLTDGVFVTTTGGASWSAMNTGLPSTLVLSLALDPTSPGTLYVGTLNTGVFKMTVGSASWSEAAAGFPSATVWALAVDSNAPGTVYAGDSENGLFKISAGTWSAVDTGLRWPNGILGLAIEPTNPWRLYAAISGAGIIQYGDADRDTACDGQDTCPIEYNPDQLNSDSDPAGDICDICPTDPTNACNPNQTASAVFGPDGGSLTTPDGRVLVTVPPAAVGAPMTFSVTGDIKKSEFGAGSSAKNLVAVVNLEPEGVTFSPPVTLTFAWPDLNNDGKVDGTGIRERNLRVYRNGVVVPGTTKCELQPCTAAACCDMAANTWSMQVSEFSEWAVGLDPCVEVATSKLTLKKVLPPAGDDKLTFKGTLTLPAPGTIASQLDVVNDGVVVRLVDADTETLVLDTEVPEGAFDAVTRVGWKVNAANTKWTYVGPKVGGPGGITKVVLQDKTGTAPGLVKFAVKGSGGTYATTIGVDPALVLPDTGQCFEATYPETYPMSPSCVSAGDGATVKCK